MEKQKQKFDEKSKVSEFVSVYSTAADVLNTADGLVVEDTGGNRAAIALTSTLNRPS